MMTHSVTKEEFQNRISGKNFKVLTDYCGYLNNVTVKCLVDGYIWTTKAKNLLRDRGCPKCGRRRSAASKVKQNKIIDESKTFLIVDISTAAYPKASMKINKDDYRLIKESGFGRISINKRGYAVVRKDNILHLIHRLILDTKHEVDHINRDKTDNRFSNLRVASRLENGKNLSLKSNNISGIAGVRWNIREKKWIAYLMKNYKYIYLGSFMDIFEAACARRSGELRYFGNFYPNYEGV